jgi:hypothetical protein
MTENCKLRKAIFSAFYNISQRNFGILQILWCSFKLWWNFCWDQNLVYYASGQFHRQPSFSFSCFSFVARSSAITSSCVLGPWTFGSGFAVSASPLWDESWDKKLKVILPELIYSIRHIHILACNSVSLIGHSAKFYILSDQSFLWLDICDRPI